VALEAGNTLALESVPHVHLRGLVGGEEEAAADRSRDGDHAAHDVVRGVRREVPRRPDIEQLAGLNMT
jgi:hypothetical protein